ncbi:zinc finger protein 260-like [Penaeus monodon]|uniref:zinc finger protein 260-like n=1 Tax=Penaeus monodon TaxID=6687 RepID=UPI0018A7A86E|nr:zinc finger protein 260-like [Penaeus monodon]
MRVQIKENPYSCETCNKDFSHKNNTVIHMRIHTKDKTQSCEICNKAFSQKQNLMRHMSMKFRKGFSQSSHMCTHVVYTKEKPHLCEVIRCAFSQRMSHGEHETASNSIFYSVGNTLLLNIVGED